MTPAIDEIRVGYSKLKLALLALVGIGMTLVSASLAFHWLPSIQGGSEAEFAGYAGVLLFGLGLGVILWRIATDHGDVVTLSSSGLTDSRIASESIPWLAIRHVGVFVIKRQKGILLDVDPQAEAGLHLTRIAKWSREPNRRLGADGLCVTASGLTINRDDLLSAIVARWTAAHEDQNSL